MLHLQFALSGGAQCHVPRSPAPHGAHSAQVLGHCVPSDPGAEASCGGGSDHKCSRGEGSAVLSRPWKVGAGPHSQNLWKLHFCVARKKHLKSHSLLRIRQYPGAVLAKPWYTWHVPCGGGGTLLHLSVGPSACLCHRTVPVLSEPRLGKGLIIVPGTPAPSTLLPHLHSAAARGGQDVGAGARGPGSDPSSAVY